MQNILQMNASIDKLNNVRYRDDNVMLSEADKLGW